MKRRAFIAALVCVTRPPMVAEIVLFRFHARADAGAPHSGHSIVAGSSEGRAGDRARSEAKMSTAVMISHALYAYLTTVSKVLMAFRLEGKPKGKRSYLFDACAPPGGHGAGSPAASSG
jgi:hypothetical protein